MGFDEYAGSGSDGLVVAHTDKWQATQAEKIRKSVKACAYDDFPLGGSVENSIPGTARIAAYEWRPFIVRDAHYNGFTYNVYVEMKVESGGSVTAYLVDEDDNIIWTSGACTSTSWQEQVTTFTPTVGTKYYLHFQKADDTHDCWGFGHVTQAAETL